MVWQQDWVGIGTNASREVKEELDIFSKAPWILKRRVTRENRAAENSEKNWLLFDKIFILFGRYFTSIFFVPFGRSQNSLPQNRYLWYLPIPNRIIATSFYGLRNSRMLWCSRFVFQMFERVIKDSRIRGKGMQWHAILIFCSRYRVMRS